MKALGLSAIIALAAAWPAPVHAQAFTAPEGVLQITLAWQVVDNTGHRFSDGFLISAGDSVTKSALLELDYSLSDRLAVTAAIPYVFAKYTGAGPPVSKLPVDSCRCWHSSFQDFSIGARYRFGNDAWAVTPTLKYVLPSHDYPYEGEAVVGRNLNELQVGFNAATRLTGMLNRASVHTTYAYAIVEKPVPGLSINRSNASLDLGYALTDRLSIRGGVIFQQTHGGVRVGSPTGNPFFPPGELTADLYRQRDRLLSVQYWQAGGGMSYAVGPVDLFVSYTQYIQGKNAHDGHAYTAGATWYLDRWTP